MQGFAIFNFGKKQMWSDCANITFREKKVFQNRPFCCLYVKLVTVQTWRQSNWFSLSYTSSDPSKKIWFKKTALAKIFCFLKRTVPTNAFNWVLRYLSQSAHGKVTSISLLVKCKHQSQKSLVSQCVQSSEIQIFCSSV